MTASAASSRTHASTLPIAAVDALEQIMRSQLAIHQQLLQCIDRKRQAIRTADLATISSICAEENTLIQKLADLEKARLELIGRVTQTLSPGAKRPLTLADISHATEEPQRTRLAAIAAQLREAVDELRAKSAVIRQAAETLSRHMSGIVQTVHSALSRARVYGQRGRIATGAPMPSVVDMKS